MFQQHTHFLYTFLCHLNHVAEIYNESIRPPLCPLLNKSISKSKLMEFILSSDTKWIAWPFWEYLLVFNVQHVSCCFLHEMLHIFICNRKHPDFWVSILQYWFIWWDFHACLTCMLLCHVENVAGVMRKSLDLQHIQASELHRTSCCLIKASLNLNR